MRWSALSLLFLCGCTQHPSKPDNGQSNLQLKSIPGWSTNWVDVGNDPIAQTNPGAIYILSPEASGHYFAIFETERYLTNIILSIHQLHSDYTNGQPAWRLTNVIIKTIDQPLIYSSNGYWFITFPQPKKKDQ